MARRCHSLAPADGNHGRNYGQIMDIMDIMDDLWLGYVCIM